MSEREAFVQEWMHAEFARWMKTVSLTGAVVFLVFTTLDLVAYPAFAVRFFVYRVVAAACLALTAVVAGTVRDHRTHVLLGLLAVGLSAATIEAMIMQTGGHASRLSTSMVVLAVGALAFIPWSVLLYGLAGGSIVGIYALPIIATEPVSDFTAFFLAVFFLLSAVLVMLPLRYRALRNLREQAAARYEMHTCRELLSGDQERAVVDPLAAIRMLHDEIATRRSTEKRLEASEMKYRTLFESAPVGLYVCDQEGNFIDGNRKAEEIIGCRRGEVIGKNFFSLNLLPLSLVPKAVQLLACNAQGLSTGPDEFEMIVKGGGRAPVEISTYPLIVDGRRVVLGIVRDLTERRINEERLRALHGRLEFLLSSSPAIVYTVKYGGDWAATFVSDNVKNVFGYDTSEFLGAPGFWAERIHPDDRERVLEGLKSLFTKDYHAQEYRFRHKDGACRWVGDRLHVVRDTEGRPIECVGLWMDITERKQAEERLREQKATLQTLIQAIPDIIFFKDSHNRYLMTNKAAEEFMGFSQGQMMGKTDDILLPPELAESCRLSDEAVAKTLAAVRFEEPYARAGKKGYFDTIKAPVFDSRGDFAGLIGVSRDITERKQVEEDLCRSREDCQRLNADLEGRVQERTERLKIISRRLLQVQEEERRYLARELHDEVGQVLTGLKYEAEHIISGLHDSRKDEGTALVATIGELLYSVRGLSLKLRPSMLDDFGLVPALKWDFGRVEASTGLRITFHCPGTPRRYDQHVEIALYRIAQEAITNVVRHAGVREATVELSLGEEEAVIMVEDHGTGFLTESWSIGQDSTGLAGMSERSMLLGGRFSVESKPGEGTRVTAAIPLHV